MEIDEIGPILENSGSILILPHVSADGDALGSSLGLGMALRNIGKNVSILLEEEVPYIYDFLPGTELVRVIGTKNDDQPGSFDTAIALDTGDTGRLGRRAGIFANVETTINIDHHKTNSRFAQYNYVNELASSVGEIVYLIIKAMGTAPDLDIATCLYVAVSTDTGGFRYSNTTAQTHSIAGDLINYGINVAQISQKVFDSTSLEKVRLMGRAACSLEMLEEGKLALVTVTRKMLGETRAADEDCEGIVNIGRNIRGAEVSAVLRETEDNSVKISLRSNEYVDVAKIAFEFDGGGHKRAAGCTVKGSLEAVRRKLLESLRRELARGEEA